MSNIKDNPKVAVVVPTYNRCDDLKRCLDSLVAQDYKNFEIIVVDNCSTDETPNLLNKYPVKVIRDGTKNVSYLFNLGIRNTSAELISFINDDTEAVSNWLSEIVKTFKEFKDAGGVGGPTIAMCKQEIEKMYEELSKKPLLRILAKIYNGLILEGNLFKVGYFSLESGAYSIGASVVNSIKKVKKPIYVDIVSTINLTIKREVFEKIGGFDENFIWVHPDADMVIRLKKIGYKVVFNPKATVYHYVNPTGDTRVPSYISRDFGLFFMRHVRPKTFSGMMRFTLNVLFFNGYWIYKFITTRKSTFLRGVSSFWKGVLEYFKIKNKFKR